MSKKEKCNRYKKVITKQQKEIESLKEKILDMEDEMDVVVCKIRG